MKNQSKEILLSVVVPIGNMARNLQYIESWLQEIGAYPIEVILVCDETFLEVGQEIQKLIISVNSTKIILVREIFGNPGSARNAGLEIATGNWVGFWDSDDVPNIKNIFAAIKLSQKYDEILVGNFSVFNFHTMTLKEPVKNMNSINSVALNPGIWRMVFCRHTIGDTRFPSLKMGEDQVFLSQLNFATRKLRFIDTNFYQYNLGNPSQLTKSRIALKELPLASSIILEHAKTAQKVQAIFDMQLFFRQQITVLKNGDLSLKLTVLKFFVQYQKKLCFSFLRESLIALILVLRGIRHAGI